MEDKFDTKEGYEYNHNMECIICKKQLTGLQSKYCSSVCKNKAHQSYDQQQKRAHKRKAEIVKMSGGQCSICGYCKNYAALQFHHLYDKKFRLDSRNLSNRTWESILVELKKCQLLCANCHSEIHNKDYLI